MRMPGLKQCLTILAFAFFVAGSAHAQNPAPEQLKKYDQEVLEFRKWLDEVGSGGFRYWVRLDSSKRPHRLYIGEGFKQADMAEKAEFVEIFSRFLAGHPEKNMLIDIYDNVTGQAIGEYGFGGFRLFEKSDPS